MPRRGWPAILEVMLADDRRSWQLMPDATWVRTEVLNGRPGTIDTFEAMKQDALEHVMTAASATAAGTRGRLDGPSSVTAPDRSPVELELKYRVARPGRRGALSHRCPVRAVLRWRRRALDAHGGPLRRHGVGCAREGRLCGPPPTGGSRHDRLGESRSPGAMGRAARPRRVELEGPAEQNAAPRDWPVSDARALVLELAGDAPLFELVTVRQVRRRRIVRAAETRVEFSLDEVDVVSGSRVVDRFVEFEAELVKGDEGPLAALATVLDADPALVSEAGSKLEAALAALQRDRRRRWKRSERSRRRGGQRGPPGRGRCDDGRCRRGARRGCGRRFERRACRDGARDHRGRVGCAGRLAGRR